VEVIATVNAWSGAVAADLQAVGIAPSHHPPETAHRDRYWIDPADLLHAQKQARERGLQIIGVYHSHPDHPAIPSETDRQLAWAEYSYLIVSVQAGKAVEARSWQLNPERQFEAERLQGAERGEQ
jgi:proteasome lid subunit RPN8/RPN11